MVDVYVASNLPTGYPRKLQKPSTVSADVRNTAETFIFDSGIGDDVSNQEVIDLATKYDADYVVAKDYLHDQERTTESVREFLDIYQESDCSSTPLIPLQPPFDQHYSELPGFEHYVLGGMAPPDIRTDEQLDWIRDFRKVAPDVYAHGLGVGGGREFAERCEDEDLLDSVDCSTPEMAAVFGKVLCKDLEQKEVLAFDGGEGKSDRTVPLAEFNSWQIHDFWVNMGMERDHAQTSVSDF